MKVAHCVDQGLVLPDVLKGAAGSMSAAVKVVAFIVFAAAVGIAVYYLAGS